MSEQIKPSTIERSTQSGNREKLGRKTMAIVLAGEANAESALVAQWLEERKLAYSSVRVDRFNEPRLQVGSEEFIGADEIEEFLPTIERLVNLQ